jgi:hypothetical protein
MPRRALVAIFASALALGARPARAGLDCDNDQNLRLVEAFAKDRSKPPPDDSAAWMCLEGSTEKQRARIEKACLKIVDRDGERSPCMRVAAGAGIGKLGGHDVFAFIASLPEDPLNSEAGGWPKLWFLSRLADPRGAAVIVDMWKAALVRTDKLDKANRHSYTTEWSSWRQHATPVLGALGGADDQAFLVAQAAATKPGCRRRDRQAARARSAPPVTAEPPVDHRDVGIRPQRDSARRHGGSVRFTPAWNRQICWPSGSTRMASRQSQLWSVGGDVKR